MGIDKQKYKDTKLSPLGGVEGGFLNKSDFFKTGTIRKTHGIKGEMMLISDFPIDYEAIKEWLFFNIEECLVPFKLETFREIGDKNALFSCKRIESIDAAEKYIDTEIYLPIADKSDTNTWEDPNSLIGYNVINTNTQKQLGQIINFIDNEFNPLLEIETQNDNIYLPFVEEFILELKDNQLFVKIPDGLLDL